MVVYQYDIGKVGKNFKARFINNEMIFIYP